MQRVSFVLSSLLCHKPAAHLAEIGRRRRSVALSRSSHLDMAKKAQADSSDDVEQQQQQPRESCSITAALALADKRPAPAYEAVDPSLLAAPSSSAGPSHAGHHAQQHSTASPGPSTSASATLYPIVAPYGATAAPAGPTPFATLPGPGPDAQRQQARLAKRRARSRFCSAFLFACLIWLLMGMFLGGLAIDEDDQGNNRHVSHSEPRTRTFLLTVHVTGRPPAPQA